MKAKDFRQEQDYPYNHFTKLTSTGISPEYDNIEEFAEEYHEAKVKTLGLFSVSKRSELLIGLLTMLEKEGGNEFIDKTEIVAVEDFELNEQLLTPS